MFNFFKKKIPITVTAKFLSGPTFHMEVKDMKELIKIFYKKPEVRYEYWFEDDIDDDPVDGYKVTNITLAEGKVIAIELTEQYAGGYNG